MPTPRSARRVQISLDPDTAIALGVVATSDGLTSSEVLARALRRYLLGRLQHPGLARAAKSLGSKMPDALAENAQTNRPPRRTRGETGSFTVFALLMVVVLFAVMGLAIDGGRMLALHSEVQGDAYVAATAAAQAAPGQAQAAAQDSLTGAGMVFDSMTTNSASGYCVTAQQSENAAVLSVLGIDRFTARATSCSSTQT